MLKGKIYVVGFTPNAHWQYIIPVAFEYSNDPFARHGVMSA